MNTSAEFYITKLYPFQDGILDIVRRSGAPFYLTGGTALSRRWFRHRYSEDLDLFVDDDPGFTGHVEHLFALLKETEKPGGFIVDPARLKRSPSHVQLWLQQTGPDGVELKVDLVNDVAPRVGGIEIDPVLGRIDNWRNILANKVAAVFRFEAKDMADLWIIARRQSFSWRDTISHAQRKEAGLDPVLLRDVIASVPAEELARVQWAAPVDLAQVRADLAVIAEDILKGAANSLGPAS